MPQTIQCDFCLLALLKWLLTFEGNAVSLHARNFMHFFLLNPHSDPEAVSFSNFSFFAGPWNIPVSRVSVSPRFSYASSAVCLPIAFYTDYFQICPSGIEFQTHSVDPLMCKTFYTYMKLSGGEIELIKFWLPKPETFGSHNNGRCCSLCISFVI